MEKYIRTGDLISVRRAIAYGSLTSDVVALACACLNRHKTSVDILRDLLDAGCDPNMPSATGWTPLMFAISNNHLEGCAMLLEAGADATFTNNLSHSPMNMIHGKPMLQELFRVFNRPRVQ